MNIDPSISFEVIGSFKIINDKRRVITILTLSTRATSLTLQILIAL